MVILMSMNVKSHKELSDELQDRAMRCKDGRLDLRDMDISKYKKITFISLDYITNITDVDITGWDISGLEYLSFHGLSSVSYIHGLNTLDVSNLRTAESMFSGCRTLKQIDIRNWKLSKVCSCRNMFSYCKNLTHLKMRCDFIGPNVTDISRMFYYCMKLQKLELNGWDVSNVRDMTETFSMCLDMLLINLSNWNTGRVRSMKMMFKGAGANHTAIKFDISKWDVSRVQDMTKMLCEIRINKFDFSAWSLDRLKNAYCMFQNSDAVEILLPDAGFGSCENFYNMFAYCYNLTRVDMRNADLSSGKHFNGMFRCCDNLVEINVDNWRLPKDAAYNYIFEYNTKLSRLDVSTWTDEDVEFFETNIQKYTTGTNVELIR